MEIYYSQPEICERDEFDFYYHIKQAPTQNKRNRKKRRKINKRNKNIRKFDNPIYS